MDCGGGPLAIIHFSAWEGLAGLKVADRRYSNPISDLSCAGCITLPPCRFSLLPARERDEEERQIRWIAFASKCRAVP